MVKRHIRFTTPSGKVYDFNDDEHWAAFVECCPCWHDVTFKWFAGPKPSLKPRERKPASFR